jgi:hypothetical protein
VQEVLQAAPSQVYGEQSVVFLPSGEVSVCIPSQEAAFLGTQRAEAELQVNWVSQSASLAHEEAQWSPAQRYGEQVEATGGSQAPFPVHLPATVAEPALHDGARHAVSGPTKPAHAVRATPSQLAALQTLPLLAAVHAVLACRGAPTTGTHVPDSPGSSQASHWPPHRVLQHTPSTQ